MEASNGGARGMRTFLIIWVGQLISLMGSGLTSFAIGVWIFQQTGQATPFAMTVLLGNLPRILMLPVAGTLADRWNRRWLMILADTGSALATLALFLLLGAGQLQAWHIYLLVVISSASGTFQEPAYKASVTMLVPKKDLARASGMMNAGEAVQLLVSPLLAGLLFVWIGMRGVILIDFVTFFFALGALAFVRIPQPRLGAEEAKKKASLRQDMSFAWRYLAARQGLFWLVWYFALVNFLLNFAVVLHAPLVLSMAEPSALGMVQAASGVGMLAGSVIIGAWGGPKRRIKGIVGFISLAALGLAVMGLRPSPALVGLGFFLLLVCIPIASGCSQALTQTKIEPSVQGRVFAMRGMISQSMMPLAFLLAGPLADRVFGPLMQAGGALAQTPVGWALSAGPGRGIGLMFVLSALVLIAVSGMAWSNRHIRNVEDELPDVLVQAEEAQPAPALEGETWPGPLTAP
jgi:MFS family permease